MFVTPCPKCGRQPKIVEGVHRHGHRYYTICCPNYCSIFQKSKSGFIFTPFLEINDDVDKNTCYKYWNEAIANETHRLPTL